MLVYTALAASLPGLVAALSFSFPFRASSSMADILSGQSLLQETTTELMGRVCHSGPERRRFGYGYSPGVNVYGWPSKGGVYVLHNCLGVELDFLGYDRFNLPLDLVVSTEDAHCDRMRRLGATWWKWPEDLSKYQLFGSLEPQDMRESLYVGWLETGGVWVLHTTVDEARRKRVGLLGNAYTMQEQCMMIERLGGIFHNDGKDCPYLDLPPAATPI